MKYLFALSFFGNPHFFLMQMHKWKKWDLVDGISAVVGDEIVLESDIFRTTKVRYSTRAATNQ